MIGYVKSRGKELNYSACDILDIGLIPGHNTAFNHYLNICDVFISVCIDIFLLPA